MVPPAQFPALPETPEHFQWSADVLSAHEIVVSSYNRGMQLLQLEDGEPLRLRSQSDQIYHRILPILEALEPEVGDETWIAECAEALAQLMVELERAATASDGRFVHCYVVHIID